MRRYGRLTAGGSISYTQFMSWWFNDYYARRQTLEKQQEMLWANSLATDVSEGGVREKSLREQGGCASRVERARTLTRPVLILLEATSIPVGGNKQSCWRQQANKTKALATTPYLSKADSHTKRRHSTSNIVKQVR